MCRLSGSEQRIAGRYLVVGEPIAGGMAVVRKAYDVTGGLGEVAIKLLPAAATEVHRECYERERAALKRLRHPAVVPLLDSGHDADGGGPFLVFPWMKKTLRAVLAEEAGGLRWEQWWTRYGQRLLSAIAAAHAMDLQHRDLKPDNVMVDVAGAPQVIDFGISKMAGVLAPQNTVGGASAPFTPREPIDESPAMTRDTHAWAALTVFALSGRDPYPPDASDPWEVLELARQAAVPRLPAPMQGVIDACLSTDASLRPRTGEMLSGAVDLALTRRRRARGDGTTSDEAPVFVRFSDSALSGLQDSMDLYAADVIDLLDAELAGDVAIVADANDPERLVLVASTLSIRASVHPDGKSLVAHGVSQPSPRTLDRDRASGWPCSKRLSAQEPNDPAASEQSLRMLLQLVGEYRLAGRGRTGSKRPRQIEVWRGMLSLLRDWESRQEDPVGYAGVLGREGRLVALELRDGPGSLQVGETRVARGRADRDWVGEVARIRGDRVLLDPRDARAPIPPADGRLRRDRRAAQTALDRQSKAVDAVEYGRAVRSDLAELLCDPGRARAPDEVDELFFGQSLDDAKQRAVAAGLGSGDLLLVQGPPGTGKTTFITELIVQELDRDPACRILLASQSHAALDHALAALAESKVAIEAVRLAREDDERVASSSRPLLLDERVRQWRADAVRSGERWLARWSRATGINVQDVEVATRLQVLANELRGMADLDNSRQGLEAEVDQLRGARGDAAQGSTIAQVLRDRAFELDELRTERSMREGEAREQVERLVELGSLPRRASLGRLDADQLELDAIDRLPNDERAAAACRALMELLGDWRTRFGIGPAFQAAVLARAQLVAATCVGLAGQRGADQARFDLVIVDEASKATGPELLIPMSRAQRIVLVGDERQLPPYLEQEAVADAQLSERGLTADEVRTPLFASLARALPEANRVTLTHQHRMHPAIGRLISDCFYDGRLTSEPRPDPTWASIVAPRPVTWLTTSGLGKRRDRPDAASWRNDAEIDAVAVLLNTLNGLAAAGGVRPTVAVLTGYSAQRLHLERRLAGDLARWKALHTVECQTVDAFQGRQADVVIYSLTRSNPQGKVGFLRERPRMNVALSRAKSLLIIIGDHGFARQARRAPDLRRVLEHVESHPEDCALVDARST